MTRTPPILCTICCAALALGGEAGRLRADDPPNAQAQLSRRQLEELIADLASASRAARFRAERTLVAAGENVLPLLPAPENVGQAAVREALARIRQQIAENAARSELRGVPFEASPPCTAKELLIALQRQTGNPIDLSQADRHQLSRPWHEKIGPAPFFRVLDAVTRELNFSWRWNDLPRQIEIISPPVRITQRGRLAYEDAFRVELADVHPVDNHIDPGLRRLYRFLFRVDVEPRLKPFALHVVDADFQAGGGEHPLELLNPAARREVYPVGGRFTFPVDFAARIPEIPSIVDLSGKLSLRVAARPVPVRFTQQDLSQPPQRVGQMKLTLDSWEFERDKEKLTVVLQITFDEPTPELASHRQAQLHRDVFLTDATGAVVLPREINLREVENLTHTVEYVFESSGAMDESSGRSAAFVYSAPTLVTDVPLKVAFGDIALPEGR